MKKLINNVSFPLPANPKLKLDLAEKIFEQHKMLGTASPLTSLKWDILGPKVEEAKKYHEEAETLKRKAEEIYEQRNLILSSLDDLLKQSRDLLKALYREEPHKIGQFGFNIVTTSQSKPPEKTE